MPEKNLSTLHPDRREVRLYFYPLPHFNQSAKSSLNSQFVASQNLTAWAMREIPTTTDRIEWCRHLEAYLQEILMEEDRVYKQLNRATIQDAFTLLSLLEHHRCKIGSVIPACSLQASAERSL